MDIFEECKKCHSSWHGLIHLKEVIDSNVLLTDYIEVWPDRISDEYNSLVINTDEFPCLTVYTYDDGKLRIEPKIDASISEYEKRSKDLQLNAEIARNFISSIRNYHVSKKIILTTLEDFVAKKEKGCIESAIPLVNAVSQFRMHRLEELYSREALEAALTVLHYHDKEYAFDLLDQSGIMSQEAFLKELYYHEWFFIPQHKLNDDHRLWRYVGHDGGANDFLSKIRFKIYPEKDCV